MVPSTPGPGPHLAGHAEVESFAVLRDPDDAGLAPADARTLADRFDGVLHPSAPTRATLADEFTRRGI